MKGQLQLGQLCKRDSHTSNKQHRSMWQDHWT